MLTAFIKFADGTLSRATDAATLTRAMNEPGSKLWLDMFAPDEEEISLLDSVFGFHPLAIEDTIKHAQRPKIESYQHGNHGSKPGYFYMVIHGPDLETFRERVRTKEVDIFVSDNYLVTVHDKRMKSIEMVLERCQIDPTVVLDPGIDMLLHNILDHLVDLYQPILEFLQEQIDELEEEAVSNPVETLLTRIALKKREMLNFRRIIAPQREVIAQLTRGDVPFIRESTRVYLRDVLDHLTRTVEMVELYRDLIIGARDIYMSSISNNLNRVMKTLTVISVVSMPLTVITGFFGMNFDNLPGLHSVWSFWITVMVMLSAVATMLTMFRIKKWV